MNCKIEKSKKKIIITISLVVILFGIALGMKFYISKDIPKLQDVKPMEEYLTLFDECFEVSEVVDEYKKYKEGINTNRSFYIQDENKMENLSNEWENLKQYNVCGIANGMTYALDDEKAMVVLDINYLQQEKADPIINDFGRERYPIISVSEIKIPDKIKYNNKNYPVTEIGMLSFKNYINLLSISLPDSVKKIGVYAFSGCSNLSSISLPESLEKIGVYAFSGCSNLSSISLPESLEKIDEYTFERCSNLSSISLPESLKKIGNYAFLRCGSLSSISLPESLEEIDEYAFSNCSGLSSVNLPESVKKIDAGAFYECRRLSSIRLSESLEEIGEYAFGGCRNLSSISLPESLEEIGEYPFDRCSSLSSISLPDNLANPEKYVEWGIDNDVEIIIQ